MARSRTKSKILQARIPDDLDGELRGRSAELGLSVSSLVRNVLMNTFNLVDDVVSDSSRIAGRRQMQEHDQTAAVDTDLLPPAFEGATRVIAWQEVILNLNAVCHECNAILTRGERAAFGVPASPQANVLCLECLGRLVQNGGHQQAEE